jgi:hypothetical protein
MLSTHRLPSWPPPLLVIFFAGDLWRASAAAGDGAEPILSVVDRGNIETRWADHHPGRSPRWLERERSLRVVEEIGP